jgi:hypothetical protein
MYPGVHGGTPYVSRRRLVRDEWFVATTAIIHVYPEGGDLTKF